MAAPEPSGERRHRRHVAGLPARSGEPPRGPGGRQMDTRTMATSATTMSHAAGHTAARPSLVVGALGIVFGDIGTSPLYTVRQCITQLGAMDEATILGVLSLISWALFIVVTVKYVLVVMRADNRGEGGILALTALALRATASQGRWHSLLVIAGLVGAALFYGDGVITPA